MATATLRPDAANRSSPATDLVPSIVSPSREDGVVRAASEVVGGPAGRRVGDGRHGAFDAARLLVLAVTATTALALLTRQHCRASLWASPDQFTHACYSDLPAVYLTSGLDDGTAPYLEQAGGAFLAAPVGTGGLLWLLAQLVPGGVDAGVASRWVFDLAVLLVAVAAVVLVLAVTALAGRRPWDAALVALSPVLLVASLVSLDLVAVALAVAGLWSFARGGTLPAGLLLGLAVTVRPITVHVLVALAVLALRTGRRRPVRVCVLAAVAVAVALNLAVLVASPSGWAAYPRSLLDAPVGYGSLWILPQLAGFPVPAGVARWTSAALTVLVVVAVALFALGVRRRPRLPVVVLLLLVGVGVVAVSLPVQASLLVLPFAALAVPRWRDLLAWGAVEAAATTGTWFYLYAQSEPSRGLPPWAYAVLVLARVAALCWLAARAVQISREPVLDPVRTPVDHPARGPAGQRDADRPRDDPAGARDDPAAGPLEGASDALVVRFG